MFTPCVLPDVFSGMGQLCTPGNSGAHVTGGWGFMCSIPPHSGSRFTGSAGGYYEFTFVSGVSDFGGYFGTNCGTADATINFYEFGTDALLGSAVANIPADCTWNWNGWSANSGAGFGRIEVIGNAFGGAFIDMDDLEANFGPGGGPGTGYCDCPTSGPCGNNGAADNGCGNSADANGASLSGSGNADVSSDTLVLSASGLVPNQPMIFFQGDNSLGGGAGVIFGDGLRCAGSGVVRLISPTPADAAGNADTTGVQISAVGGVNSGDTQYYQAWYRDPGGPCGSGFNLSNGYEVTWQ